MAPGPEARLGGAPAQVQVDFGAGHLPLVLAVGLVDQQLRIGILEAGHQRFGRALVEVTLAQGIDVVVIDRADDVLEEPRLLVDTAPRRRLGAHDAVDQRRGVVEKEPAAAQAGNRHDRGERQPARPGS